MDLRELEMFLAVAEQLNFTRASERLHVAESAISRKIGLLEEELGEQLFNRTKKGVYLTLAGETLQIHARRIFQDLRNAKLEVSDIAHHARGHIRVASLPLASIYFLPSVLREFRSLYPNVQVEIMTGPTEALIPKIRDNSAELGVLTLPIQDPDLEIIPLLTEEMVVVWGGDYDYRDLSIGESVTPDELSLHPLILPDERSYTRKILERLFAETGIAPQIVVKADNAMSQKSLVKAGIGITILPLPAIAEEARRGELQYCRIRNHSLTRPIGLVIQKTDRVPKILSHLIQLCTSAAEHETSGASPSSAKSSIA